MGVSSSLAATVASSHVVSAVTLSIAQYTYAYEYVYPVKLHAYTYIWQLCQRWDGLLILDVLRLSLFYRWQAWIKMTASYFSKVGQAFNSAIE